MQPADSSAPGRLTAQRQPFVGPTPLTPHDMYAVVERGSAERSRTGARLAPGSRLSTNAYFGRFPASHWQRWTSVTSVQVTGTVTGTGRITVTASDIKSDTRPVAQYDADGADGATFTLTTAIDRFVDGGALWLDVEAGAEPLHLSDVAWTVDAPPFVRPTALVMCTFNRVEDCLNTLTTLAADSAPDDIIDAVYVVDQGTDPVSSRPRFADIQQALGARLHYIRQPNLGGAGGFTRGLYEVAAGAAGEPGAAGIDGEHANVLFMDDDIVCEPDIVVRLTAFANRTVEPVIVGGQMLYLLHPEKLHVGAEFAHLATLEPGKPVKHAIANGRVLEPEVEDDAPEQNVDIRVDAGYNGWWSCLIPSEIVKDVGYPMPMFFQWDDIEYGYRARSRGHATITLPGAGVWHADFAWKDWDDWHRYFNLRNAMITGALHGPRPATYMTRVMLAQLTRYLVSMQYGLSATLLKAIEDYLAGPEILQDGGQAAAREIRELRARYPETVRHPASNVPGLRASDYTVVDAPGRPIGPLTRVVLMKRFADQLRGRFAHDLGAVRARDGHWWHVSRFRKVVITDASQEGVRVRTFDRDTLIALAKQARELLGRMNREGEQVAQRWRDALPELSSRETWQRLYGL